MVLLLLTYCLNPDPDFKTRYVFEPIPEETEIYLQSVHDITTAPNGETFVLDGESGRIHIWDPAGGYVRSFGNKGEGPGEFNFRNNSNALVYRDNTLFVFDSETGRVTIFDEAGTYLRAFYMDMGRKTVPLFDVVDAQTILANNTAWEGALRRFATYNTEGKLTKTLHQIDDETWRYTEENGQRKVILIIYETTVITGFDDTRGEVLIGDNAGTKVQISDLQGKPLRELSLALVRHELTREIRRSWEEMPWFKQQSFYKLQFPERLPTYNRIVSFDEGFAFYMEVYGERESRGIVTDKNGKTLRHFHTFFGEGGGIYGTNGALYTVRSDDMGDLTIRRVSGDKP